MSPGSRTRPYRLAYRSLARQGIQEPIHRANRPHSGPPSHHRLLRAFTAGPAHLPGARGFRPAVSVRLCRRLWASVRRRDTPRASCARWTLLSTVVNTIVAMPR